MTFSAGGLYNRFQSPKWGAISFFATILSGIAFLLAPTKLVFRGTFVGVAVASLLFVFSLRWFVPQIRITCLQDSQFFDIQNHHYDRHPVYNGHAKIEVYAEIPNWMTEFEIELDSDGPFELSEWTPSHISRSDDTLICKSNIEDCKFKIQVIGEADELGETTYNLYFKNGKTGRTIHSIKLVTEQEIPSVDEDELTEEEAEEWGLAQPEV